MSFQGDVRGIGLAELLQGLARGRKEGTLTLSTKSGLSGALGLLEGKAYLLADASEVPQTWHERAQSAWAMRDDEQVEFLRTAEIAHAERLEGLYKLLDGEGVHFRFEPGALAADQEARGEALSIEYLLLEYARISDELGGMPAVRELPATCIPIVMDPMAAMQAGCPQRVLAEIDGYTTIQELTDRLAQAIRATRLAVGGALLSGAIRLASATETLHFALGELQRKRYPRAAARLGHWCRWGPPGPVPTDLAERLANEWIGGRLSAALKSMSARDRRCLLRRLDHSLHNPSQSVVHWLEATRIDKTDRIARLKRMVAEYKEGSNPERPGVRELLDLARELRESSTPRRAAPLLVMAANLQPASMQLQMELGVGLLAAGRTLEASPWLLAGARELLEQGHADRAILPLRNLLEADPRHREARVLLTKARRQSTHVRRMRKALLSGLGVAVVASVGAAWHFHRQAQVARHVDEVRTLIQSPTLARQKLGAYFSDHDSQHYRKLASEIAEYEKSVELDQRQTWIDLYQDVRSECQRGEPTVALERIRSLPEPPRLRVVKDPWPERKDLYEDLADRLFSELEALGAPTDGAPQQVHGEKLLAAQAEAVVQAMLANDRPDALRTHMIERMEALSAEIAKHQKQRDELIAARIREENLDRQDELLHLADSHERNGDYLRAKNCYDEIVALDPSGRVRTVLRERIETVERKYSTMLRARELAQQGKHELAISQLEDVFSDVSVFMLPFRIDSYPSGARVETNGGRRYTTPFVLESTVGTVLELRFDVPGFEQRTVTLDRPGDRLIYLSRECERVWQGRGRVDAIPVSIGDDHLIVSRQGEIARVGAGGELRWSKEVKSLSGIARAPVFLPERPGHLLAVTEDGEAWIIEGETGHLEGPWDLESAPVVGPAPTSGGVSVRLADERVVEWRSGLRPARDETSAGEEDFGGGYRYGATSGFQVARRRNGESGRLASRFYEWTVEVRPEAFVAFPNADETLGYSIEREGEWEFIAWEAASGRAPMGRVWVSDAAGVRSFVPLEPRPR